MIPSRLTYVFLIALDIKGIFSTTLMGNFKNLKEKTSSIERCQYSERPYPAFRTDFIPRRERTKLRGKLSPPFQTDSIPRRERTKLRRKLRSEPRNSDNASQEKRRRPFPRNDGTKEDAEGCGINVKMREGFEDGDGKGESRNSDDEGKDIPNSEDGRNEIFRHSPSSAHASSKFRKINFSRCSECDISFRYDSKYEAHCKEAHGKEKVQYACEYCGKSYYQRGGLAKHFDRKHAAALGAENPYRRVNRAYPVICAVCGGNFRGWAVFEKHAISEHGNVKMLTCPYCDHKFFRRSSMNKHLKEKHADQLTCRFCKNIFDQTDVLKNHEGFCQRRRLNKRPKGNIVRTGMRPNMTGVRIRCDECRKIFESFPSLNDHYRFIHPDVKLYPCDYCEAAFAQKHYLGKHLDMRHADKDGDIEIFMKYRRGALYTCRYCRKDLVGFMEYQKHAKEHPRKSMFFCKECGRGFTYLKNLSTHAKREHNHEQKTKVKCRYCTESYFHGCDLKYHEAKCKKKAEKIEGMRRDGKVCYFCQDCQKNYYTSKTAFQAHVRRHATYDFCKLCNRGFNRLIPNALERHTNYRHRVIPNPHASVIKSNVLNGVKTEI